MSNIVERINNSKRNIIIEGPVSSGKTKNVLFPIVDKAIENEENLFIIDSKEEYLQQYYNKLKAKDYNIVIINLKDVLKSEGWNPLHYSYKLYKSNNKDVAVGELNNIGDELFGDISSQDPFWDNAARDFFTGVTLGLFDTAKEDEINFSSVCNFFDYIDKPFGSSNYVTAFFSSLGSNSLAYKYASSTFLAPKDTKGSILSVARLKLRVVNGREQLSKLLSKTTFDITEDKPNAIIFISRDDNTSMNILTSLFIGQLYDIVTNIHSRKRFNFILDNMDMLKCNRLTDILSSSISRNIRTIVTTRSIDYFMDNYGIYTDRLCDIVRINDKDIIYNSNGTEEKYDNDFTEVVIKEVEIDYPYMKNFYANIFNIEKYVTTSSKHEKIDIDNLIRRIDDQIDKIKNDEEIDKIKDTVKLTSYFEQFRIDDKK